MIEIEALSKKFDSRMILNGITAKFAAGDVVSLVGPSGGGKSTLLRCLNGLESFDAGSVRIGDYLLLPGGEARNRAVLTAVRQKLGFVFQQWHLFAHRTALGNVMEAPVHVRGMNAKDAADRARAMLEKVGMSHRAGAYPAELSGGEQQRVAIARALAMDPTGLLLDEPTSALDPERVADVVGLLRGLAGEGLTMLIVTHEMRFAREVSTRLLVLHSGQIIEDGTPREVTENPRDDRTRAFLGLALANPHR